MYGVAARRNHRQFVKTHALVERHWPGTAKQMYAGDLPLAQICDELVDQARAHAAAAKVGVDVHVKVRRKLPWNAAADGLRKAAHDAVFQAQHLADKSLSISIAAITPKSDLRQQRQGTTNKTLPSKARRIRATGEVTHQSPIRQRDITPVRRELAVRLDPNALKQLPTLNRYGSAVIAGAAAQLSQRGPYQPVRITILGYSFYRNVTCQLPPAKRSAPKPVYCVYPHNINYGAGLP